MEDFINVRSEARIEMVREWLQKIRTSDIPILVTGMQENVVTAESQIWELFASNRANWVLIGLSGGPDTRIIGTKAKVTWINGANLKDILGTQQAKHVIERFVKAKTAAAITSEFKSNVLLVFPPDDSVLVYVREILEGRLSLSDDPAIRARFNEPVREIMMTLDIAGEFLKAA